MADICDAIRGLCRVRATLLDALGNVAAVTNNSWVSAPDQTADAFDPARVALEFWLKAYDGDAQDQVRPWIYLLFPGTFSWVEGDITIGSDFTTPGFVGKSLKNDLWGNGPYSDVDVTDGQFGPIFNHALVASDPPDAACGFAHIAPGS
jgi:hypothetical protein